MDNFKTQVLLNPPNAGLLEIGNVDGPSDSTSTDNAIVRWDGAGGRTIQNSVLIVADTTGALSGFTATGGITFGAATTAAGGIQWSDTTFYRESATDIVVTHAAGTLRLWGAGAGSGIFSGTGGGGTGFWFNATVATIQSNGTTAISCGSTQNVTLSAAYIGSTQPLSGAGAANVTTETTKLTTAGTGDAISLANGVDGQTKILVLDVLTSGGHTSVLTPTTKTGFATVTFAAAGDAVTLKYVTTRGWMITGSRGVVIA